MLQQQIDQLWNDFQAWAQDHDSQLESALQWLMDAMNTTNGANNDGCVIVSSNGGDDDGDDDDDDHHH